MRREGINTNIHNFLLPQGPCQKKNHEKHPYISQDYSVDSQPVSATIFKLGFCNGHEQILCAKLTTACNFQVKVKANMPYMVLKIIFKEGMIQDMCLHFVQYQRWNAIHVLHVVLIYVNYTNIKYKCLCSDNDPPIIYIKTFHIMIQACTVQDQTYSIIPSPKKIMENLVCRVNKALHEGDRKNFAGTIENKTILFTENFHTSYIYSLAQSLRSAHLVSSP